ncbi:MAG: HK97 gp10 family phage protein [Exiguobacterium sp.]|nr:HK97 gp10 family phage protein [Exiguobacterium sp.]
MADRSVSEQLKTVLDEESKHVREVTEQAIKTVSKQAVQRLKTDSPKKSGDYANGWTVKRVDGLESIVYNKTAPGLTHLLENGHAVANQYGNYGHPNGRVKGIKHIKPVEQWANAELQAEIERNL